MVILSAAMDPTVSATLDWEIRHFARKSRYAQDDMVGVSGSAEIVWWLVLLL